MNLTSGVNCSYSEAELNSLIDKIRRIEQSDPDIISIPRVFLEDRKNFMQEFVSKLSDSDLVDVLNQRVKNQDCKTKFDFYFENEVSEFVKEKWEEEKNIFYSRGSQLF